MRFQQTSYQKTCKDGWKLKIIGKKITSLISRRIQIKTTVRYHGTPIILTKRGKQTTNWRYQVLTRMQCKQNFYVWCWWECQMVQPLRKTVCQFLKTLKCLLHILAIVLLVSSSREMKASTHQNKNTTVLEYL